MPQRIPELSTGAPDRRAICKFGVAAIAIIGITVTVPAARRAAATLTGLALKAKRGEPAEAGDDVPAGTINPAWMFPRGTAYLIARPARTAPALTGTTITAWCQTCGSPVEDRQCACYAHVADALQRYLGMDFDGSAQMAADLWKQEADKERVWSAEYASDHDVETYPAPLCPPGLAAWAHGDCAGTFTFRERLPEATVFACAACGQQRVAQDDPEASDRAMNALAAFLIDSAFGPDQMAPAEVREQDARIYPHDEPCPRCGRRQWTDETAPERCQACGYVCTDEK